MINLTVSLNSFTCINTVSLENTWRRLDVHTRSRFVGFGEGWRELLKASLRNGCQCILRGNAAMLCIVQEMYAHINAKINIFEGIGGHMQYKYKLPEL